MKEEQPMGSDKRSLCCSQYTWKNITKNEANACTMIPADMKNAEAIEVC